MSDLTMILSQIEEGDPSAAELLLPLVCMVIVPEPTSWLIAIVGMLLTLRATRRLLDQ